MKYIGGGFGFLTFLLALVPALYVMTTGFSENSSDFWFSQSVLGVAITGSPGYAWYLMIVVAIIALISAVAILLKKIIPEDASVKKVAPPVNT
jgi:putative copper export protein